MTNSLNDVFAMQKEFAKNFYDIDNMTADERKRITLNLVLSMHSEVSSLLSGLDYQTHRPASLSKDTSTPKREVNRGNLKFEAVDVLRYLTAVMSLWNISADDLLEAHAIRDLHLQMRHNMEMRTWQFEPVVILDIDDVMSRFKEDFQVWLEKETGVPQEIKTKQYYPTKLLRAAGFNPEELFNRFIAAGELSKLGAYTDIIDVVQEMKNAGCWIHLVTARPDDDLTCRYDTFKWISERKIPCDRLTFSNQKYLTISHCGYGANIAFAVEDSSKHVREYAQQDIRCFVPRRSYNEDMAEVANVFYYDDANVLRNLVELRLKQMRGL